MMMMTPAVRTMPTGTDRWPHGIALVTHGHCEPFYLREHTAHSHTAMATSTLSADDAIRLPRVSIFNAFSELGGLEQDSTIAHWIFNDPSIIPPSTSSVSKPVIHFRFASGSRFHERLDSLECPPVKAVPPQSRSGNPSKALSKRSRSKPPAAEETAQAGSKSFFRSRPKTSRNVTVGDIGSPLKENKRPSLHRLSASENITSTTRQHKVGHIHWPHFGNSTSSPDTGLPDEPPAASPASSPKPPVGVPFPSYEPPREINDLDEDSSAAPAVHFGSSTVAD